MTIDLATAKAHCRIDFDEDDALVQRLIAAAMDHLSSIGVDMEAVYLPSAVCQAVLMLVAHLYENREATASVPVASIAIGVDRLVAPYREVAI
ncbi:head-tail connector protein [Pararhizobium mangrovi]|uniref:Phage gp6-like head-tail connector protein n=1 Tax=Pararhizobium mangrovi TaxID=2590452 RepID=A0A506UHF4_9HYPH|nr:head-tail connector protein [Pararhizobium mangrovi]TPW32747.1 phage gp6-like head-tail connector protein [Pararhizobium mangrovi]